MFPLLEEPESGYMGAENPGEALNLGHVHEAVNEVGNTDSAASANECGDLDAAMQESFWNRVQVLVKQEDDAEYVEPVVEVEKANHIYDLTQGNDAFSYPKVPDDWKPSTRAELGQPPFSQVDNPGNWPEYYTRRRRNPRRTSIIPSLPVPDHVLVPPNKESERKLESWSFHYKGWDPETTADLSWDPC
jgi:hypothetical protein